MYPFHAQCGNFFRQKHRTDAGNDYISVDLVGQIRGMDAGQQQDCRQPTSIRGAACGHAVAGRHHHPDEYRQQQPHRHPEAQPQIQRQVVGMPMEKPAAQGIERPEGCCTPTQPGPLHHQLAGG